MLSGADLSPTARRIAREFCGNAAAVASLGGMIETGRLPHAFIIEGADGLGKSSFARLIARGAMCGCREPLSGECGHCRKLRENIHPDLIYIQGSGKTNAIPIDAIRAMRKDALIAPNEAGKRVFILEDCDNMLPAAQNAFLKIFEEAPPHVVFIITCRSAMNLLTTIRSRGRIITLHPVEAEEGASQTAEQANSIADGILEAMCSGSELDLAVNCAAIGKDRAMGGAVCAILCERLRCGLMTAVGAGDTVDSADRQALRLGALLSPENVIRQIDEINQLSEMLRINISMPLFNTKLAIILQRRK